MSRRGGVAVEMALVLPVLLVLLVGTVDWGWFFVQQAGVVVIARDAAHAGVLDSEAPAAAAAARASAALTASGVPATGQVVQVTETSASVGPVLTVAVQVTFEPLLGLVPCPEHLSARTTMRLAGE